MRALRRGLDLAACCVLAMLTACASGLGGSQAHGAAQSQGSADQAMLQKRATIRLQLALAYYEQGQFEVAQDELRQALAMTPENADLYGARALVYMGKGEAQLAQQDFQQALMLAPHNAELNNNYGTFLCQNGHVAESLGYFDAALKSTAYASPEKAFNNAGACSLKLKDYAGAEYYLLQALQRTPNFPATNANLALVYYERGNYARAGEFIFRLGKITKIESLTAEVLWLAIKVQRKLGDTGMEAAWVTQLRSRHSGSAEYAAYQREAFDE